MGDVNLRLTSALSDRYAIERELGQGGMATVYLAEDIKHHRKVAIKVLRPDLAAALGPDRFMQEIEIAARLQHPHILGVHDSGQSDGFLYYVMPYVEGESLRERLSRQGELPIHEAVRLLTEIADALSHAHHRGVVHRDIKPENVMLSGRHALVMDFGVAKAVNEASGRNRLTTLGVALGTPAYMAPEQASADPHLDHRVDIYALGVVGYELLAGRPPFTGASPQQVLAAHVTQAPALVSAHRPAISPALTAVIMRALEKRPADRWQTAEEMLGQLEPLATPSGGMTPTGTMPVAAVSATRPANRATPRWLLAVAGIVVLAAVVIGGSKALRSVGSSSGGAQSVAVLPFENVAGDTANVAFTDGVQSEILTDLTRLADLQVTSRSSVQEYRSSKKPVKQIGTELGVRSLLQGQVQRAGNQVHVTVQLVDAASDRQIWAESYDRELTAQNIFTIQGDIARNVAQALRANFSATERATAEKPPTNNLEALDWYHRGKDLFTTRGGVANGAAAIHAFERAVALDSGFALAWGGLAAARGWQIRSGVSTDTVPARAALDRAMALAPGTPETEIAQAYFEYYARGDLDAALTHFRAVAKARPNDIEAVAGIGYIARRRRQFDEALEAEVKVTQLDPRNVAGFADLGFTYLATRQYGKAEEVCRRALIAEPGAEGALNWLASSTLYGRGDTAASRALLSGLPPGISVKAREGLTGTLDRFARHFDASTEALARVPLEGPGDAPLGYIGRALNDVAAGAIERAKHRADSTVQYVRTYLSQHPETDGFGNRADFYTYLGVAEAILGRRAEAMHDGEEAVRLNPVGRDATSGPRSAEGLIVIHLVLGQQEEAIRLILQGAHEPYQSGSIMSLAPGTLRLDPIFDGVRSDPRIQALLKDDAAWIVK